MTDLTTSEDIKQLALNSTKNLKWIKVIGLGDRGVGKTSIIKTFCESKFSLKYTETVGVDYGFKLYSCEGGSLRVTFWDFGGGTEYELIRKNLYVDIDVCVLVYDVTTRPTFDNLNHWMHEISAAGGKGALKAVAANKCDKSNKMVDTRTAEAWAKRQGLRHYAVSACTGEGIQEMFHQLLSPLLC